MGRLRNNNALRRAKWLLLPLAVSIGAPAIASPFTCSGDIYQVQSGQLRVFDPVVSSYVDIGSPNSSYNATGFNTLDNFGYGMQGTNVVRIHSDGSLDIVANVGFGSFAGDVDDSNNLWVRRTASRYSRINLATGAVDTFDITGTVNSAADVVFVRNGGVPYLLALASGRVGIINLNTFNSTRVDVPGLPSSGFGAQWTDFNGRLFAFQNSNGQIFEIFDVFSATPTATFAAQGDPSGNNDGFSCPDAPFPNLPPVAEDDDFTTPFETAITPIS